MRRLERELRQVHTPEKLARLQRQRDATERKLNRIGEKIETKQLEITRLLNDTEQLERRVRHLRQTDHLHGKVRSIELELPPLQAKEKELRQVVADSAEKFEPLRDLQVRQEEIKKSQENAKKTLKKYKRWWRNATQNVRIHFLLALFAVQHFAKEDYQIKRDKSFGFGGIVEVHFR